jgi:hypothetical protein
MRQRHLFGNDLRALASARTSVTRLLAMSLDCGNFREIARQNHGLIVPAYRRTRDCLAPLALCLIAMRR